MAWMKKATKKTKRAGKKPPARRWEELSPEHEVVMAALLAGYNAKAAGELVGIAYRTVRHLVAGDGSYANHPFSVIFAREREIQAMHIRDSIQPINHFAVVAMLNFMMRVGGSYGTYVSKDDAAIVVRYLTSAGIIAPENDQQAAEKLADFMVTLWLKAKEMGLDARDVKDGTSKKHTEQIQG